MIVVKNLPIGTLLNFYADNIDNIKAELKGHISLTFPQKGFKPLVNLIYKMVSFNPEERPLAEEVVTKLKGIKGELILLIYTYVLI